MLKTKYHIVPKNNGYFMLGKFDNYFTLVPKHRANGTELVFDTEQEAQAYIDRYVFTSMCIPERFSSSGKGNIEVRMQYHCPDCGYPLRCMCTIGADESASGFSESLYHCENYDCANDFNIVRDADGRFVKMTRHFWG